MAHARRAGSERVSRSYDGVPVAQPVDEEGTRLGSTGDIPIGVGAQASALPGSAIAIEDATPPEENSDQCFMATASSRPAPNRAPVVANPSAWNVRRNRPHSDRSIAEAQAERPASYAANSGATGKGRDDASKTMSHTGTWNVPGCGTSTGTGRRRFAEEGIAGAKGSRAGDRKVSAMVEDHDFVADGGPVLVACGQGQSMYDVKGFMSSWVLVGAGDIANTGLRDPGERHAGHEKAAVDAEHNAGAAPTDDHAIEALTAAGNSRGGSRDDGGYSHVPEHTKNNRSWALRSATTPAGEGTMMCSACVPAAVSGKTALPGMLVTGGKDNMLREWRMVDGRPRLVAELSGHTDWISCCALMPSLKLNTPPSVAVSGARDGSVRFWSKSTPSNTSSLQDSVSEECARRAEFATGYGDRGSVRSGGGTRMISTRAVGSAGWTMASCISGAHGSSEFVSCCACPGKTAGAVDGWVATGGSDWSVRLWDVAKSRELGRLSFMGHNRLVRSLAASSDGKLIVSGGDDHKVIVWSPQNRRALATLKGHAGAINGIAIDPGAQSGHTPRWIASGGDDGFLLVWDPRSWKCPATVLRGDMTEGSPLVEGRFSDLHVGAKSSKESEGSATAGTTFLNGVNCLAACGAGGGGEWLFGAGETVVRGWRRRDGMWTGGFKLPGDRMGGVSSLSVVE